jgi:hypothetical protein
MAINIAGEIEKEYKAEFDDILSINFGLNNIELKPKIALRHKINFWVNIVFIAALLILIQTLNSSVIFFILFVLLIISVLLYNYHWLLDKVTIDFNQKEITLHNKLWVVNRFRQLIGKTINLPFAAISHFEVQYSKYSIFSRTQNRLLVKSFDKPPLLIGSFQFEINARRLDELLQYHITGKTRGLQA